MQLGEMLDTCGRFEERAAAVYRKFAVRAQSEPTLADLWAAMAREEDEHAAAIRTARLRLPATAGWRVQLDGWHEAIAAIDASLQRAERLGPQATADEQLAAGLAMEMTELEVLRRTTLEASGERGFEDDREHLTRLADTAARCSSDPHVNMQAAMLKARLHLSADPDGQP